MWEHYFNVLANVYTSRSEADLPIRRRAVCSRYTSGNISFTDIFGYVVLIVFYVLIVGIIGLVVPYFALANFEVSIHLRPGATCTVTGTHIDLSYDSDDDSTITYYDPKVYFTLLTPEGKSYTTSEYQSPEYNTQADAQTYLSQFRLHSSYGCWYTPTNPTDASFFEPHVGFWDYAWLVFCAVLFLICGVLPNVVIVHALFHPRQDP